MSGVVNIRRGGIPTYLQGSGFYNSLDLDGEEEISVPDDCFKVDDTVNNADDLRELLSTLRYWAVPDCPRTLVDYVLSTIEEQSTRDILTEYERELQYLTQLREFHKYSAAGRLTLAMRYENVVAVRWLLSHGCVPDASCFTTTCETGNLQCLQLIIDKCDISWLTHATLDHLICYGYLDAVNYLHVHGFKVTFWAAADVAVSYDQIAVLQFYLNLHNPAVNTRYLCQTAAKCAQLSTFQYVYEAGFHDDRYTGEIVDSACEHGRLDIIKYLHSKEVHINTPTCCTKAVNWGRLEVLQYLHENGCSWTQEACTKAASLGHLTCLQYLHEHGCPWSPTIFADTAMYGHVQCLKYLLENGCEVDAAASLRNAVWTKHVSVLQLLHEHGHPLDHTLCALAMLHGRLECLRYLHEHGVEWGDTNTDVAAKGGHLECIQYAHEHGCAWGANTCDIAAANSHLNCLKYAYEHGSPWDVAVYRDLKVPRNPTCRHYIAEQLAQLLDLD